MITGEELIMLQSLPLDIKVAKTKLRIEEWVRHFGEEGVYVSFSGGKDSTVLLHLVRSMYPSIPAVFVDTGLEYPELKEFVKSFDNVTTLRPSMSFKQVIEKYGYPVVSKEQAKYIWEVREGVSEKTKHLRLHGDEKGRFKISRKWKYLLKAPFRISSRCCDVMKKAPIHKYENTTKRVAFVGTMACESKLRKQAYLQKGCNAFENTRPLSAPLGFWTEQDVLVYIKENNLEIPSVYGEIIEVDGVLKTTRLSRSGCVYCGFGIENDGEKNRYQMLEETHPQLHKYCMKTLGFEEVCQYMDIPFDHRGEDALLYES